MLTAKLLARGWRESPCERSEPGERVSYEEFIFCAPLADDVAGFFQQLGAELAALGLSVGVR